MSELQVAVTFDASTQTATFDPENEEVPWGEQDTIKWTLTTINNGSTAPATFASEDGIYFKASNNPPWPGGDPQEESSTVWTVEDDNTSSAGVGSYNYGAKIVYNGQTYDIDPEITNDPQGG